MSSDLTLLNDIFRIKKLFTDAYYDYRFSSLLIKTIDQMSRMIIPESNLQRFYYNDTDKYIEIELKTPADIDKYADDLVTSFIIFCYEDPTMRDILFNVNSADFKVFINTMNNIRDGKVLELPLAMSEHFLANNLFNILNINSTLVRINLM